MLRCGFLSFHVTSPLIDGVDGCSPIISNPVKTTRSGLEILASLFVFVRTGQQDIDNLRPNTEVGMYISQPITRPSRANTLWLHTCIYGPICMLASIQEGNPYFQRLPNLSSFRVRRPTGVLDIGSTPNHGRSTS